MNRSPSVREAGLLGALYSGVETCVDPRQIIAELPAWLTASYGVEFRFNHLVTERPTTTERLWICSGEDLQTLYPEVMKAWGLRRCKLQMLRSAPMENGQRIGPMLAAGLTLRHYKTFAHCPSLPKLQARVARENPEFDRYGIHVMASQNGRGEIVIGDSHEYDLENAEPFNREEIDRLILEYLHTFLNLPGLRIQERWYGFYVKHPSESYLVAEPEPGVTLINGVGGNGMTLSFGLAEQIVNQVLGESR